jgi:hypothetical protein
MLLSRYTLFISVISYSPRALGFIFWQFLQLNYKSTSQEPKLDLGSKGFSSIESALKSLSNSTTPFRIRNVIKQLPFRILLERNIHPY